MFRIPKPEYTAEVKEIAVKRVRDGQSVGGVSRELGLIAQTLRSRAKAANPIRIWKKALTTVVSSNANTET